jgi:hypothetical protein
MTKTLPIRLHFPRLLHWGLSFQHMNFGGDTFKLQEMEHNRDNACRACLLWCLADMKYSAVPHEGISVTTKLHIQPI